MWNKFTPKDGYSFRMYLVNLGKWLCVIFRDEQFFFEVCLVWWWWWWRSFFCPCAFIQTHKVDLLKSSQYKHLIFLNISYKMYALLIFLTFFFFVVFERFCGDPFFWGSLKHSNDIGNGTVFLKWIYGISLEYFWYFFFFLLKPYVSFWKGNWIMYLHYT